MNASPASPPITDLRSDTTTKPTPGMRDAMARAEVGDDVFGEDPSVNLLQQRAAALVGKEAALYVPSGTMANQLALLVHCRPGDEVIIGEGAHNANYESGAGAALAGVQFAVAGTGGTFSAEEMAEAVRPNAYHYPPTRLVCVENTHNRAGGIIWSQAAVVEVATEARSRGLALHLDGARLWNASAASGLSMGALAAPFDTVCFCLSKGLGAPVGSLLCGPADFIREAHRWRKRLGGGMRQAGILAAAGLYALDHHVARLVDDHASARAFAAGLAAAPHVVVSTPPSNIVMIDLRPGAPLSAQDLVDRARERGVLLSLMGPRRVRAVTHLDVSLESCAGAAVVLDEVLSAAGSSR